MGEGPGLVTVERIELPLVVQRVEKHKAGLAAVQPEEVGPRVTVSRMAAKPEERRAWRRALGLGKRRVGRGLSHLLTRGLISVRATSAEQEQLRYHHVAPTLEPDGRADVAIELQAGPQPRRRPARQRSEWGPGPRDGEHEGHMGPSRAQGW